MKILTGEEFHKLPEGVLFINTDEVYHGVNFNGTPYTNGILDTEILLVKGESIPNDYYEASLGIKLNRDEDYNSVEYDAFNGKSIDLIFTGGRNAFSNGNYKDKYFGVLERKDIDMIIKELKGSKGLDEL